MGSGRYPLGRCGGFLAALAFALACVPGLFSAGLAGGAGTEGPGPGGVHWISRASAAALSMPYDVAADRRGVMFVLDSGNRAIYLFTPSGEFLREISGKGAWRDPQAVAAGSDGTLYLADGEAGRVLEFDMAGRVRRELHAGRNARLTGVGVYGGAVYCVDNRNDRILVFRKSADSPERWGRHGDGPGEFHSPFRIAIDGAGRVFVSDVMNARVQWFSPFGQHLGTLRKFGAGQGRVLRPTGIALDGRGRLWVGDSYTGLVQQFEERGAFLGAAAIAGRPVFFGDPAGLALSPSGLWVADQKNGRVGVFRK